jgi:hypothetical protein
LPGGLDARRDITVAFASTAMAQWAPRWGAAFPDEIERGLEAQGYVLTAPLVHGPRIYLADVSAGPAGHERPIIDARNGQVLERFTAPGRVWESGFAARGEDFGEPQSGDIGPALNASPANVRIPAAV